jgi:hypothetical protein
MIIAKRLKRLWNLLTTEKIFHNDPTGERARVRRPP